MRIARWTGDTGDHEGIVVDGSVIPFLDGTRVSEVLAGGLAAALELGARTAEARLGALPLAEVTLRAPLDPVTVRDFVAFEEHVEGVVKSVDNSEGVVPEWYEYPTFYFTNPHMITATGETVTPPLSQRLDFELELGAVIGGVEGSDGRNLSPEGAHPHIFGYTIFNDWSARDVQAREMKVRLGPCKGKDFATTLGPWIVTADEFEELHDDEGFLPIVMSVEVNGVEVGRDLFSNMGWPFAELVAYASRNSRVVPGDVLGSGTVGRGCLAELWGRGSELPPLQPGDEVIMRVERIGEIRNVVGEPVEVPHIPAARQRSRARSR
ncbi:fumarylacetoacetate hydrolase family protein [Salinibacterium sp. SYSU T00001]|uniref:fumarylacetoacetate hydrolase family protein n=1 Tax=Homoserinimonas sedimenticola TaxID=2986805 RepID=UPI00223657F5|nr:fumarylacetoacetate hydrolase family protein [Salinibacterium sedimenticola]MCW4385147.1 fumarylacetoacetate hydrolase family protein [Salinibacterium sedimenticola]